MHGCAGQAKVSCCAEARMNVMFIVMERMKMSRKFPCWVALLALACLAACGDDQVASDKKNQSGENNGANNAMNNAMNNATNNAMNNGSNNTTNNTNNVSPSCDQMCTSPPAASCFDGSTQQLYASAGTCDQGGACVYEPMLVACDAPPAIECADAQTARRYEALGSCSGGTCSYASVETSCAADAPAPTCDGDTLKVWDETPRCEGGECVYQTKDIACGDAGCCQDHCCEMTISNAAAFGGLVDNTLRIGPPNGTFDSVDDCDAQSVLGVCELVAQERLHSACVCRSQRLVIGDLRITGEARLVLLASESITVQGHLNASGIDRDKGPGSYDPDLTAAQGRSGGQGATYAGLGGGGSNMMVYGTPELIPLQGGTRGQASCGVSNGGGGGGGAIQLSAGSKITVSAGGKITAHGGGGAAGASGDSCNGGAGGGSGGGILIEAPEVELQGAVLANGGGGGGGGSTDYSGRSGDNGGASRASGGARVEDATCALYGSIYSGSGGQGSGAGVLDGASGGPGDSETRCIGSTYSGAGGGGGGAGRIRVNTRRAQQGCLCNGDFSPAPTFGSISFQ